MTPTIQIIGTKKCQNTRKADRFFRERGLLPHLVDLNERALTVGELRNICRNLDPDFLLDRESKAFMKAGLAYMVYDPIEEALKNPALLKTPIVRCGKEVTIGLQPEIWKEWLKSGNVDEA
jgi:arsenate reductase-like glutaredoxin family protein